MRKIALEEHFLSPGFEDYWLPTMGNVDQKAVSGLLARLRDFGDLRLQADVASEYRMIADFAIQQQGRN